MRSLKRFFIFCFATLYNNITIILFGKNQFKRQRYNLLRYHLIVLIVITVYITKVFFSRYTVIEIIDRSFSFQFFSFFFFFLGQKKEILSSNFEHGREKKNKIICLAPKFLNFQSSETLRQHFLVPWKYKFLAGVLPSNHSSSVIRNLSLSGPLSRKF